MKKIIFIVFSICISFGLLGQISPKEEIQQLKIRYGNDADFSADLSYQWFESCEKSPSETIQGKVFKANTKQYMKVGNVETLNNAKYSIVIDNAQKIVLVSNAAQNNASPVQLDWDKVEKLFTKLEVTQKDEDTRMLTLASNYGTVNRYELEYNSKDYLLKKITCYVANKESNTDCKTNKIVVTYQNLSLSPVEESVFSERKYIVSTSKGFNLQGNYRSYELVNHLR